MSHSEILLIEDNPDDAELTRIAFSEAGIDRQLVVVRDGAEALDYLFAAGRHAGRDVSQLPAIVLLDLNLPKLDGREVLQAIRADARTRARLRWPARAVARPGYAAADAIGAISQSDAERLAELGARAQRIAVTGDPRIDSVLDVIATQPTQSPDQKLLVAGSTWPADEDLLLEAFATVRQQPPDARLLLVPHQPSSEHLERLDQAILARGLPPSARSSS